MKVGASCLYITAVVFMAGDATMCRLLVKFFATPQSMSSVLYVLSHSQSVIKDADLLLPSLYK